MKPKSKPQITRQRVDALLKRHSIDLTKVGCVLIGVRGYYRDSMGKKGKNDIGVYDDAFIWVDATDMATFNGNTDPSRYYQRVATLVAALYWYKKGLHGVSRGNPYPAFRQAGPVRVRRFQAKDGSFKEEPLGDTINIHRGGANTTSSAGCQTVPPDQWGAFKAYGDMLIARHKLARFPYLLVENDGSIA